jgi:hypothetical protein
MAKKTKAALTHTKLITTTTLSDLSDMTICVLRGAVL